jgi:hypothetical protein
MAVAGDNKKTLSPVAVENKKPIKRNAGKQQKINTAVGEDRDPEDFSFITDCHRDFAEQEQLGWGEELRSPSYASKNRPRESPENILGKNSRDDPMNKRNSITTFYSDSGKISEPISSVVEKQGTSTNIFSSSRTRLALNIPMSNKAPTSERAQKQKTNSFAFSFTQAINNDPGRSPSVTSSDSDIDIEPANHNSSEKKKSHRAATSQTRSSDSRSDQSLVQPVAASSVTMLMAHPPQVCSNSDVNVSIEQELAKEAIPKRNASTFSSSCTIACGATLSIVGKIGSAVELCADAVNKMTMNEEEIALMEEMYAMSRMPSLDTLDEQLLNEVDRLNRMNSWDTNGTFNSVGTTTTMTTADTGTEFLDLERISDDAKPACSVDDHVNKISDHALKAHKTSRKRKNKKRRERAVNFEYPPISSMKGIPRITKEERKNLFFSEIELNEYERDRKYSLCDDVEVIAVEFSDSEESSREEESESENDWPNMHILSAASEDGVKDPQLKSSIRAGKYAQPFLGISHKKDATITSSTPKVSQAKRGSLSKRASQSSMTSSESLNKNGSPVGGNNGRIKGVQIYLRQRSIR